METFLPRSYSKDSNKKTGFKIRPRLKGEKNEKISILLSEAR